jgi:hypothetical protein
LLVGLREQRSFGRAGTSLQCQESRFEEARMKQFSFVLWRADAAESEML